MLFMQVNKVIKKNQPTKEPDVIFELRRLKSILSITQKQSTPLSLEVIRDLQA